MGWWNVAGVWLPERGVVGGVEMVSGLRGRLTLERGNEEVV